MLIVKSHLLQFIAGALSAVLAVGASLEIASSQESLRLGLLAELPKALTHRYEAYESDLSRYLTEKMAISTKKSHLLASTLLRQASYYKFDPALILALVETESSFRQGAVSSAGARGLLQLMPDTALWWIKRNPEFKGLQAQIDRGKKIEDVLHDPFVSLRLGVSYLAYLRDEMRGEVRQASDFFVLAAYRMGPARIREVASKIGVSLDDVRVRRAKAFPRALRGSRDYFEKIETRRNRIAVEAQLSDLSRLYPRQRLL